MRLGARDETDHQRMLSQPIRTPLFDGELQGMISWNALDLYAVSSKKVSRLNSIFRVVLGHF